MKFRKEDIKDIYKLSPMQEGIYFNFLQDPGSSAYFQQMSYRLKGQLNVEAAEKSMNVLMARYDILRVVFNYDKIDEPLQVVLKKRDIEFSYRDIRSSQDPEQYVAQYKLRDRKRNFDLHRDVLIRVAVLRTGEYDYEFIWSYHHILMDGWCMSIIYNEYTHIYQRILDGGVLQLREPVQYSVYLKWLAKQDTKKALAYWEAYLAGYEAESALPAGHVKTEAAYMPASLEYEVGKEATQKLSALAKRIGVTINTVVQTLWGILLSRYSGHADVVFGAVVSGRPAEIPGIEAMVGLFINTVPVRISFDDGMAFGQLAGIVQKNALDAEAYHFNSLSEVQALTAAKNKLLDHILVFENYPVEKTIQDSAAPVGDLAGEGGKSLEIVDIDVFEQTNYHFNVIVYPGDDLAIHFRYNAAVYDPDSVKRLRDHLHNLILTLEDEHRLMKDMDIVGDSERSKIVNEFNATVFPYPKDKTVYDLFEQEAMKNPHKLALVCGEASLTYGRFLERSGILAACLREKGIGEGAIVALHQERSLDLMISIFGILKAGAAYLPIDPDYPLERKHYLIADSNCRLVITGSPLPAPSDVEVLSVSELLSSSALSHPMPHSYAKPSGLAYIIYTSGSTGQPKGVMIEHYSLVNRLNWMQRHYAIGAGDVILQKTPYTFDVSVWELLLWSISGSTLVLLPPGGEKDPEEILKTVKKDQVSVMHFVPSMLKVFLQYVEEGKRSEDLKSLKWMICSGEALGIYESKKCNELLRKSNGTILSNLYGPTEATIDVSYYDCPEEISTTTIPIGKPIDNIGLLVLGSDGRMQGVGLAGELHIAGDGLARGYLNKEALTREKFIAHPFIKGERLYKTGDLARWLPDGNIEYLGRIDDQVKIRGYRIELGEIEARLLSCAGVKEAIAAAKGEASEKYLVGYYVADEEIDESTLKTHLLAAMPSYMVPQHILRVDRIPLTANGKANRKALPLPDLRGHADHTPPTTKQESELLILWKEVLKADKLGVHDNYFSLGGDSIKAIRLLSKINKKFGADLRIADLFSRPTIATLAEGLDTKQGAASRRKAEMESDLEKLKRRILSRQDAGLLEDAYPMSSIQKGMIFYSIREAAGSAYHDQFIYQLSYNDFDVDLFRKALKVLADRHAMLRTAFNIKDHGEPVQLVWKDIQLPIGYTDIGSLDDRDQELFIRENMREDRGEPFALETAPLWRMAIFSRSHNEQVFLWSFHHAILDGWSNAALMTELNNTYLKMREGSYLPPDPLRSTYRDYVIEGLWDIEQGADQAYWKQELAGYQRLDFGKVGDVNEGHAPQNIRFMLDDETSTGIFDLARKNGYQAKNILFAAYAYMLYTLTYENDFVVGLVSHNRPLVEDGDKIIGCFLNTLPVRLQIPLNSTWSDYQEYINDKMSEIGAHGRMPFSEILNFAGEKPDAANPLFDTIFNYVDFHIYDEAQSAEGSSGQEASGQLELEKFENTNTFFDVTAIVSNGGIDVEMIYRPSFISSRHVEQLVFYFQAVLRNIVGAGDAFALKENLMSAETKHRLSERHGAAVSFPENEGLAGLFDDMASKFPDRTALVFQDIAITYKQLQEKSFAVARRLRAHGIAEGDVVGVLIDRHPHAIVAVLSILRTGAAYVPIDEQYPSHRKEFIVGDCRCRCVLVKDRDSATHHRSLAELVLNLEDLQAGSPDAYQAPFAAHDPQRLAYILYTSGSTGTPKGVMVPLKNVVNLAWTQKQRYGITEADRMLLFTTMCFDASVEQIWISLLSGAALVIIDKETLLNPIAFETVMNQQGVTHLDAVPSFLATLNPSRFPGLKRLVTGGDVCPVAVLEKWIGHVSFYNAYGPTEATVTALEYLAKREDVFLSSVPIGKPIANTQAYVMAKDGGLQMIGSPGELYIGGQGVTMGYRNQARLTAERFIADPYTKNGKLYRTGDLVRWLDDGELEFIGRADSQVKIRGFRIEPEDVEHHLRQMPGLADVAVDARALNGDKVLCAYYTADQLIEKNRFVDFLFDKLPGYMHPSYFLRVDSIPLSAIGKVNRSALPDVLPVGETSFVKPEGSTEETLAELWAQVLPADVRQISACESFFDIGGHSLKAAVLSLKIAEAFGVHLPISDMFTYPTIRALSQLIDKSDRAVAEALTPAPYKEFYRTTSAQKRLYVLQRFQRDSVGYNVPLLIPVGGKPDKAHLASVFSSLLQRHEILRTSFLFEKDELYQRVHEASEISISEFAFETLDMERLRKTLIQPFDLETAPLIRVSLLAIAGKEHYVFVDMHHMVTDELSHGILERDFLSLYRNETLPELKFQFKDYAEWMNSEPKQREINAQGEFWKTLFANEIPVLELPFDYPRPVFQTFEGATVNFHLSDAEADALLSCGRRNGTTVYMTLLGVFALTLSKLSNSREVVIGTPVAGRRHQDLQDMVGMFINTLAVPVEADQGDTIGKFLKKVKQLALNAFDNQDYPFDRLLDELHVPRDLGRNPLFDVMFNQVDYPEKANSDFLGSTTLYEHIPKATKFDLTLTALKTKDGLVLNFDYTTALFSEPTINRFIGYIREVIRQLSNADGMLLGHIDIIPPHERVQLLALSGGKAIPYFSEPTVSQLFEKQVSITPDRRALVFGNASLTYSELNAKSNWLAEMLRRKGAVTGTVVSLLMEPSLEMIVSILGILKAGACFLPLNTEFPEELVTYILNDAGSRLLLTNLSVPFSASVDVIQATPGFFDDKSSGNLPVLHSEQDLAYMIYTSGTTGKPKGVMLRHAGLVNYVNWIREEAGITENDRTALLTSYAYDLGYTALFSSILTGAELHLVPREIYMSPLHGVRYITEQQLSYLKVTPSLLGLFVASDEFRHAFEHLRLLVVGGEAINTGDVETLFSWKKDLRLINHYGPTEATIGCITHSIDAGNFHLFKNKPVIGRSINHSYSYILDRAGNLCPVGVAGELCLGGKGLASGYLNNRELTSAKFVHDPFQEGALIYKTGDLARRLENGAIEFLGRIDKQIKLRGFRIELEGIEAEIRSLEQVRSCAVKVFGDKYDKYICAYLVLNRPVEVSEIQLLLERNLPAYMIPQYFVILDDIPVTANGKVDMKSLREPQRTSEELRVPFRNDVEKQMAAIWSTVLSVPLEDMHANSNFFVLGGHSLKAMHLLLEVQKVFLVDVGIREIFMRPNLSDFSDYIMNSAPVSDDELLKEMDSMSDDELEDLLNGS